MQQIAIADLEPGAVVALRSTSKAVYIVRRGPSGTELYRAVPPDHDGLVQWWDNQWVPVVQIIAYGAGEPVQNTLKVGCRHRFLVDAGGPDDTNHYWATGRVVESLDELDEDGLAELLAEIAGD